MRRIAHFYEQLSKYTFSLISVVLVKFDIAIEGTGNVLLGILSDGEMNGRSFFVSEGKWAQEGYDLNQDQYYGRELLDEIQRDQIVSAPVEKGLLVQTTAWY